MQENRDTVMLDNGVYVALLRSLNVGGKNKLKMAALRALFEELGCADVRTYIQSGNVVFRAPRRRAEGIPERVTEALAERYELQVPVVLRSGAELSAALADNPLLGGDVDPKHLHVAFLSKRPKPERVAVLDPHRSPPDELVLSGRELYLHLPNGVARTKLTNAYFDKTLKVVSTVRNWKTVNVLADWCAELEPPTP